MSDKMDVQHKALIAAIIVLILVTILLVGMAKSNNNKKTDAAILAEEVQDDRILSLEYQVNRPVENVETVQVIDEASIAKITDSIKNELISYTPTAYCLRSQDANGIIVYQCKESLN